MLHLTMGTGNSSITDFLYMIGYRYENEFGSFGNIVTLNDILSFDFQFLNEEILLVFVQRYDRFLHL